MMTTDEKIDQILKTQLSTGLMDVKKELSETKVGLNAKIDRFHKSLSEDILAFGEDLYKVKQRVQRIEKRNSH